MAFLSPRRQTVVIFLTCLVLVLGTFFYVTQGSEKPLSSKNAVSLASHQPSSQTHEPLHIDETAFADWRKQFSAATQHASSRAQSDPNKKLTSTDLLGRSLFSQYMELRQANLLNNEEIVNQLTENLAVSHLSSSPAKIYTRKDLTLTSSSDPATLKAFSISLKQTIEMYRVEKNESTILQEYLITSEGQTLKHIDPIIAIYKKIIASLIAMPTPEIVAQEHLDLINGYNLLQSGAESLRKMNSDSVQGLSGIRVHMDGASTIIPALKKIYDVLESHNIHLEIDQKVLKDLLT